MPQYSPFLYKRLEQAVMCLAIFLLLFANTEGASNNATEKDFNRLLFDKVYMYDLHTRPVINQSEPIDVLVTFNLVFLQGITESRQIIQLNAWINFTWFDQLRPWDPNEYGGLDVVKIDARSMWIPRVVVSNSLTSRDVFGNQNTMMTVLYNGVSRWYPGSMFKLSCDLNLTYFPFDTQRCAVNMQGVEFNKSVRFRFSEAALDISAYKANSQWMLLSSKIKLSEDNFEYNSQAFSGVRVQLVFQRRPLFYVVTFIVPVMFMSFLCLFGFCVPVGIGERSSFAITVQLSLTLYITLVTSIIPQASKTFPILVYYIFSLLFISGFCVIVIVIHELTEYKKLGGTSFITNARIKSYLTYQSMAARGAPMMKLDADSSHDGDISTLSNTKTQRATNFKANDDEDPDIVEVPTDRKSGVKEAKVNKISKPDEFAFTGKDDEEDPVNMAKEDPDKAKADVSKDKPPVPKEANKADVSNDKSPVPKEANKANVLYDKPPVPKEANKMGVFNYLFDDYVSTDESLSRRGMTTSELLRKWFKSWVAFMSQRDVIFFLIFAAIWSISSLFFLHQMLYSYLNAVV